MSLEQPDQGATRHVPHILDIGRYSDRLSDIRAGRRHAKSGEKEIRFFLLSLPGPVAVAKKKGFLGKVFS